MPTKLVDFQWPSRGRQGRSWSQYADGAAWEFTAPEDFDSKPGTLSNSAHKWARSHGYKANVHFPDGPDGKRVVLRFTLTEEEAARRKAAKHEQAREAAAKSAHPEGDGVGWKNTRIVTKEER